MYRRVHSAQCGLAVSQTAITDSKEKCCGTFFLMDGIRHDEILQMSVTEQSVSCRDGMCIIKGKV